MKTPPLTQERLAELTSLVTAVVPRHEPLHGAGPIVITFRDKGYSSREIADFLTNNGVPVSHSAVRHYIHRQSQNDSSPSTSSITPES